MTPGVGEAPSLPSGDHTPSSADLHTGKKAAYPEISEALKKAAYPQILQALKKRAYSDISDTLKRAGIARFARP